MGPAAAPTESRVRAVVLRRMLRGEVPDLASLARELAIDSATAASALATLSAAGAIYLADGAVAAAYPLSAVPTQHRVHLDGVVVYACCAIDALAVPVMAGRAGRIASRCAHCDAGIAVQVEGDRVVSSQPETLAVFHVRRDGCEDGPAALTRCPLIQFFCGADHLARWRSARPRLTGDALTLAQAVDRAREIFGSTIDLVRDPRLST